MDEELNNVKNLDDHCESRYPSSYLVPSSMNHGSKQNTVLEMFMFVCSKEWLDIMLT